MTTRAPPLVPAVRLRGATKRYGSFCALDHVDLDIEQGECFALLGPNGAGKTTLISLVAGTARATEGTVEVLGHDVRRDYRFTRRAVGLVPQEINFDPFFTVEETLRFQAGYFGVHLTEERLVEILGALGLLDKRQSNTRALSGGMKRRMLIAKALVHRPPVLFLDEPTAGVDVELRRDLWTYVRKLRAEGTTVVLTTHYLEEAEQLADRIGVIKGGKLLLLEHKEALMNRFGHRSVRLSLGAPLDRVPPALAALSPGRAPDLVDDGRTLVLHPGPGVTLAGPLRIAAQTGLDLQDVRTLEPRLEDVIVELLRGTAHPALLPPLPSLLPSPPASGPPQGGALRRDDQLSSPPASGPPQGGALRRDDQLSSPSLAPAPAPPRDPIHPTLGVRTLFRKEVMRFLRVPGQTLLSPLITTVLYFLVFGYSLGDRLREIDGVSYARFLVPGLIMLGIINNSFLNTSSSLFIMKLQGTVVDVLVTPLTTLEFTSALLAAACVRGLLVGGLTWLTAALFVGFSLPHPLLLVTVVLLVAVTFAAAGLLVALWADKFEQVNFLPTFVITPMTFLGGVFYSASMLPEPFHRILYVNPIYYMIETTRVAVVGHGAVPVWAGLSVVVVLATGITAWALALVSSGYKMRA